MGCSQSSVSPGLGAPTSSFGFCQSLIYMYIPTCKYVCTHKCSHTNTPFFFLKNKPWKKKRQGSSFSTAELCVTLLCPQPWCHKKWKKKTFLSDHSIPGWIMQIDISHHCVWKTNTSWRWCQPSALGSQQDSGVRVELWGEGCSIVRHLAFHPSPEALLSPWESLPH